MDIVGSCESPRLSHFASVAQAPEQEKLKQDEAWPSTHAGAADTHGSRDLVENVFPLIASFQIAFSFRGR